MERLTGSLAFGALARVVLVAAKHQTEGEDGRTVRLPCARNRTSAEMTAAMNTTCTKPSYPTTPASIRRWCSG